MMMPMVMIQVWRTTVHVLWRSHLSQHDPMRALIRALCAPTETLGGAMATALSAHIQKRCICMMCNAGYCSSMQDAGRRTLRAAYQAE